MILMKILFAMMFSHATEPCERRFVLAVLDKEPSYFVEEGVKKGHSYTVLTDIIKKLDCRINDIPGLHAANKEKLIHNRIDIMGLALHDPELDKFAEFIPAYKVPRLLIVRKGPFDPNYHIEDYLKNPKVTFATLIGAGFFMEDQERKQLFKNNRLHEVPSPEDIFTSLIKGRTQAAFSSPLFIHHYLTRKNRDKDFEYLVDPAHTQELGIYVSKKRVSEKDRQDIKEIIKVMKKDGSLLRSAKDYIRAEDLKYYID